MTSQITGTKHFCNKGLSCGESKGNGPQRTDKNMARKTGPSGGAGRDGCPGDVCAIVTVRRGWVCGPTGGRRAGDKGSWRVPEGQLPAGTFAPANANPLLRKRPLFSTCSTKHDFMIKTDLGPQGFIQTQNNCV